MMSQDNRLIPLPAVDRTLERPLSDLGQIKSYGPAANEPTQLRDYLFVVLKRKWLILSLCLVVTSLVAVQMFRQPSIYQAEATIRIEQRSKNVLLGKEFVLNSQPDANFWGTQIKLLQSPVLARQVAVTLDLQHNPTFFGGQAQGGIFSSLRRMFTGAREKAKASPATQTALNIVGADQIRNELSPEELAALEPYEDMIIGNEQVDGIVGTNLFTIKYRHTDPEMAQKVANTLADVFRENNLARSTAYSTKAEDQLAREIADLQAKIRHDTEVLFNYARDHNLPLTSDSILNVEGQRLADLTKQLLEAENTRKTAQAVYESAKSAPDKFSIPEVQKSARISALRDRISMLNERREALKVTYTDQWPEVKKLDVVIKPLEAELDKVANETIAGLKAGYEASLAHENSIRQMYNQQHGTATQQTRDQIEMAQFSQTLETNKQYLNTLMQKKREVEVAVGDKGNEVSIETYSRVPKAPIGPARLRNVMIAFLLSLVAGIGLAFLLDFLDDTVKSIDDIDRYIHLPALAMIPASRGERVRLKSGALSAPGASETTALALIDDVRSPIAESYRHLRTSLLLSSAGQPPKTILVTSSQPSEGKTTTAINTAFMLAQTGVDVLIIDCDLRRPRLHAQFEISNARGLTTWLSGEKDLDGIIQSCARTPNLKILTSGPVPPNPAELLGSEEMRRLLAQLSEQYTHIIIDSPPAISFTDASILSTMVDGVMLVVHGGRSSRAVVRRAKQQLLDVGAHIFGVVLNNVKLETQDYYYQSYYSNYYSSDADAGAGASAGERA
jgi:capsular exopolysaccharide synthesis family protein